LVMPIENSFVGYHRDDSSTEEEEETRCQQPMPIASDEREFETNNGTNNNAAAADTTREARIAARTKLFVNPVLLGAMSTVAGLFLLIGATCGPAFPDIVDGSVTAYLTTKFPNSQWYQMVNVSVMVAVFLTFPLQLTPAMEVLGEWFGPGCDPVCWRGNSSGGNGCCLGGGGLLSIRRRAGRGGGRHAVVAQADEIEAREQSNNNMEEFCDEGPVSVGPSEAEISNQPPPLPKNSCFGAREWIFRRYLVVFGCALVVLTVNDLGLLMSLFGALGNTGLAAMPCVIHWRLVQTGIAPMNFLLLAIDAATIGVSLGVAVIGVAFSVREILDHQQQR